MTGRERVMATLGGRATNRRPVAPLLSLYGARLTGCPVDRYYRDASAFARGQVAVDGLFHPDVLFGPFCASAEAAAFGCIESTTGDGPPIVAAPAITSAADAGRLELPDPCRHPRLLFVRDAVEEIARRCGRRAVVAAVTFSPLDLPALLMGLDAWLETLLFEPEQAQSILALTTLHFVAWSNALLAAGADLVAIPLVFSNPSVVGPTIAESVVAPILRESLARVHGPVVLHHGGGPLAPHLPLLVGLPNVAGFALEEGEDLRAARTLLGPGPALLGGIDGPSLDARAPADIARRCRATLAATRDDRQFLLASSAADIPLRTPPANVFALVNAVREDEQPASVLIACSVFRPEIDRLAEQELADTELLYLDSMLHHDPAELDRQLTSVLGAITDAGRQPALLFGDCHAHLLEQAASEGLAHPSALNCCDWYLGSERYRQLRREGAFIVLPEWLNRWREAFDRAVGTDPQIVREIMRETHTRLVYVSPPGLAVPSATLDQISAHTGLPWEVEELDEASFIEALRRLLQRGTTHE